MDPSGYAEVTTTSFDEILDVAVDVDSGSRVANDSCNLLPVRHDHTVLMSYLLTFLFGFTGNTLTIFVILRHRSPRGMATCFILNLAIADDLAVACLPLMAYSTFVHRWVFGNAMCKLLTSLRYLNPYVSIFTMTLMSIDRYLAVVHPIRSLHYRTNRNALFVCLVVWIVGGVVVTPVLIYSSVTNSSCSCQLLWPAESRMQYIRAWALVELTLCFLGPIGVMVVSYSRLLLVLLRGSIAEQCPTGHQRKATVTTEVRRMFYVMRSRQPKLPSEDTRAANVSSLSEESTSASGRLTAQTQRQESHRQQQQQQQQQRAHPKVRRVTMMIFILTMAFIVCWTPYHVMHFIRVKKHEQIFSNSSVSGQEVASSTSQAYIVANIFAQALIFVSSCCNPFIYYITSRNFHNASSSSIEMRQSSRRGKQTLLADPSDAGIIHQFGDRNDSGGSGLLVVYHRNTSPSTLVVHQNNNDVNVQGAQNEYEQNNQTASVILTTSSSSSDRPPAAAC